jgi:hypothetical protein
LLLGVLVIRLSELELVTDLIDLLDFGLVTF